VGASRSWQRALPRGFDCRLRVECSWRIELAAGQVLRATPCSVPFDFYSLVSVFVGCDFRHGHLRNLRSNQMIEPTTVKTSGIARVIVATVAMKAPIPDLSTPNTFTLVTPKVASIPNNKITPDIGIPIAVQRSITQLFQLLLCSSKEERALR